MRFVIYNAGWKRGLIGTYQSEATEEGKSPELSAEQELYVNFPPGDIHNLSQQQVSRRLGGLVTKPVTVGSLGRVPKRPLQRYERTYYRSPPRLIKSKLYPKPRAEHPTPNSARYHAIRQSQGKADQSPGHVPPRKALVSSQRGPLAHTGNWHRLESILGADQRRG